MKGAQGISEVFDPDTKSDIELDGRVNDKCSS